MKKNKKLKVKKKENDLIIPSDIVALTLNKRVPKNKAEEQLKKEIKEVTKKGYIVEIPYEWQ